MTLTVRQGLCMELLSADRPRELWAACWGDAAQQGALPSAPSFGIGGRRNLCISSKDLRENSALEDEIVFIFQRKPFVPTCILGIYSPCTLERPLRSFQCCYCYGVFNVGKYEPHCLSWMWSICLFENSRFKKRRKMNIKFCLTILITIRTKICPRRLIKYAFFWGLRLNPWYNISQGPVSFVNIHKILTRLILSPVC